MKSVLNIALHANSKKTYEMKILCYSLELSENGIGLVTSLVKLNKWEYFYQMPNKFGDKILRSQSNFFAAGCISMQHYVTNLNNIM